MAELIRRVSGKAQVTLPVEVRKLLGIEPGDKVAFRISNGEVSVGPVRASVADLYQSVPGLTKRRSDREIDKIAAEDIARAAAGDGL